MFSFAAVGRKKLTAAFYGGSMTSNGGALLVGQMERHLGIAEILAGQIDDPCNLRFVTSSANGDPCHVLA